MTNTDDAGPADTGDDAAETAAVETAADGAEPGADSVALPPGERSTVFAFEHKVFSIPSCFFALTQDRREPALFMPLGDLRGAVSLATLRTEFGIKPDSPDGALLEIIGRSLRYVREIRPGDSIPRELLDGSASWTVEERHRAVARSRVTVRLVSWLTGSDSGEMDIAELQRLADDPETKTRVQEATIRMAEKLGLGAGRRQEVLTRIEDLVRELAYIEALRDRFRFVQEINGKLRQFVQIYRRDVSIREEIQRMQILMRRPLSDLETMFAQADAQTGEIFSVMRNFAAQVKFVRDVRDDLHSGLMQWDGLIDKWQGQAIEGTVEAEALLKETYRFLARNFIKVNDWPMAGKL